MTLMHNVARLEIPVRRSKGSQGNITETAISIEVSWPLITTPQTKFECRFIVTDVFGTGNKIRGTKSVHTNGVG